MMSPFWYSLQLCSVLICGPPIGQSVIYARRYLFQNISLHITHHNPQSFKNNLSQRKGPLIVGAVASLVPRPSYHGVPVRGPGGNNGRRMRLIKTARYA